MVTPHHRRRRPETLETFVVVEGGLRRVRNLIALYDQAAASTRQTRRTPATDILRGAVVLLHATLEEYVRYVAGSSWPLAAEQELNDVPLIGNKRGAKFALGSLARHRGKTVDAIIGDSVREYLAKKSFSSLADFIAVLRAAGIPINERRIRARTIHALIQRRHQIVHEADQVLERKPRDNTPRAVSRRQVLLWLGAVDQFVREIDRQWTIGRW